MSTWYFVQVERRDTDVPGQYGPFRSREQAEELAGRFNKAAEKAWAAPFGPLSEDEDPEIPPPYAYVVALGKPKFAALKADWLEG